MDNLPEDVYRCWQAVLSDRVTPDLIEFLVKSFSANTGYELESLWIRSAKSSSKRLLSVGNRQVLRNRIDDLSSVEQAWAHTLFKKPSLAHHLPMVFWAALFLSEDSWKKVGAHVAAFKPEVGRYADAKSWLVCAALGSGSLAKEAIFNQFDDGNKLKNYCKRGSKLNGLNLMMKMKLLSYAACWENFVMTSGFDKGLEVFPQPMWGTLSAKPIVESAYYWTDFVGERYAKHWMAPAKKLLTADGRSFVEVEKMRSMALGINVADIFEHIQTEFSHEEYMLLLDNERLLWRCLAMCDAVEKVVALDRLFDFRERLRNNCSVFNNEWLAEAQGFYSSSRAVLEGLSFQVEWENRGNMGGVGCLTVKNADPDLRELLPEYLHEVKISPHAGRLASGFMNVVREENRVGSLFFTLHWRGLAALVEIYPKVLHAAAWEDILSREVIEATDNTWDQPEMLFCLKKLEEVRPDWMTKSARWSSGVAAILCETPLWHAVGAALLHEELRKTNSAPVVVVNKPSRRM